MAEPVTTYSTEAAAIDGVQGVINPTANTAALTTAYPEGGIPFDLPSITASSVISEPTSQDTSFNTFNYILSSQTNISTAQLQYMLIVTKEQWIFQDDIYMILQGSFSAATSTPGTIGFTNAIQTTGLPMINGAGVNIIADMASWYSQIQSIQYQLNDGTIQNVPAPYVALMSTCNTQINGQNYLQNRSDKHYRTFEGTSADLGIRDSHVMEGRLGRAIDYSTWNYSSGTQQITYMRIPFKEFMYFFMEDGKWMTSQTKLLLIFNFLTPTPKINVTSVMYGPRTPNIPQASGYAGYGNTTINSRPLVFTPQNVWLEINLYTPQSYLTKACEVFNVSRPLTTLFWTHQVIIDPTFQGVNMALAASWGTGPTRNTVRASGLLPKHLVAMMQVDFTWTGSTTLNWSDGTNYVPTWTRRKLMPGMIYISRLYLGGQDYGRNVLLDTLGYSTLNNMSGWVNAQKFRRDDRFMQQMNRLQGVNLPFVKGWQDPWLDPRIGAFAASVTNPNEQAYAFAYYCEMIKGPNGIFSSEDFSHETLSQYRSEQLEVEYYIAPSFDTCITNQGGSSPTPNLAPFAFADVVMNSAIVTGEILQLPPTAMVANLYWILPYPIESTHGAGRQTSYAYIQYAGAGTQSLSA